MRAVVLERFGGPDSLVIKDVPRPEPGPGEIRVRIHATSVNPVDTKLRQAGSWAVEPPVILGYDASGVVEAVGAGVTDLAPGDEVYYTPEILGGGDGTYAEAQVVPARLVARKPENLDHAQAAAIPLAGGTAFDALHVRARVQPWERVLVHGGAGGVGHFAVQLACAAGCEVFSTAGAYNLDLLRKLGVHRPIDYRGEDFVEVVRDATGGEGVDVVLDTQGGAVLQKSLAAVRPHGRVVTILGGRVDLTPAYQKNVTVHGLFLERARDRLEILRTLVERQRLRPVVDLRRLEDVAEAHRDLERGHHRKGKIVLEVL